MAKVKTAFFCQNCGNQYPKWQGQCAACKSWNTIAEEVLQKAEAPKWQDSSTLAPRTMAAPVAIKDIQPTSEARLLTADNELNRVLGGGLVPGSLVLLGGEPGIGKSTLCLQIALCANFRTLYVSGEESSQQIKMRADRLQHQNPNCFVLTETNTAAIFSQIKTVQPNVLVIDSVQTLCTDAIEASAGSISQVKACTAELIQFAKATNTPVILIGHINKDGQIAGPKILEHMVDTVLQFEGDHNHVFRILRSHKNRFGSTNALGIYEMLSNGLREVSNPSELLLSEKDDSLSGNAVAVTMEGTRPLLIEIQALVSSAVYGTPQRSATGFNAKRLNMLLAVLEKRAGFRLGAKDVFLNITGGIHVDDPAIDLGVVAAVLSSTNDEAIAPNVCFAAEVGLSGEIRPIPRIDQRIAEAEKLGFQTIYISKYCKLEHEYKGIRVKLLSKIEELVQIH
jgi:DNA repair protein RadA/Sms